MLYYINFVLSNLLVDFLSVLLVLKIFKINFSKVYLLLVQIFEICASVLVFVLGNNFVIYFALKLIAVLLILLLITSLASITEILKMMLCYIVLFFSVCGFLKFLNLTINASIENLFNVKILKNIDFIVEFLVILYIFAIFLLVSSIEKKRILDKTLAKLSFCMFGKHIDIVGFIDSGNCLYDSLTKKPVIIVSKKALFKYFDENELAIFLSSTGRVIECETISETSLKLMVYDIKKSSFTIAGQSKEKACVVGVVDKIFEGAKYDCLLHRDFL